MKNLILAAMIAVAGVSTVDMTAQAANTVYIGPSGVVVRHNDPYMSHHRKVVRQERREFKRELRRDARRHDSCRTRTVKTYVNHRLIVKTTKVCN